MSDTDVKAIYRRYLQEVFVDGNLDAVDRWLAPTYVYHDAPPGTPAGPEGIKQVVRMFHAAFPDFRIDIEDQIAEGDKVCSRTISRGTHRGPLFGIPPTGRTIAMPGLTLVRIVNGRITDSWVKNDVKVLMAQLGVERG